MIDLLGRLARELAPALERPGVVGALRRVKPNVYQNGRVITTIHPEDGRVVNLYEGGYTAGRTDPRATGTPSEARQVMRAGEDALRRHMREHALPEYYFEPGAFGEDERLAAFYRRMIPQREWPGYEFFEEGERMGLRRLSSGGQARS